MVILELYTKWKIQKFFEPIEGRRKPECDCITIKLHQERKRKKKFGKILAFPRGKHDCPPPARRIGTTRCAPSAITTSLRCTFWWPLFLRCLCFAPTRRTRTCRPRADSASCICSCWPVIITPWRNTCGRDRSRTRRHRWERLQPRLRRREENRERISPKVLHAIGNKGHVEGMEIVSICGGGARTDRSRAVVLRGEFNAYMDGRTALWLLASQPPALRYPKYCC